MEAAIRFSQNSYPGKDQRFLYVDVAGKALKLCLITQKSKHALKYDVEQASTKVPAFRAFDWHPVDEGLVVVGQAGGEATLVNIQEGQQDSTSFQVRSQRLCNAVTLNSQNLIAAGLDKVRTDFCLNVWDYNQRLPGSQSRGFSKGYTDPLVKLASGEPITSLKFFHDNSNLLVAGVKGQFVRLYDLREPTVSNALQFSTRCVHNIAIDFLDDNYLASCYPATEPTICLWDRRMVSRSTTAHIGFGAATQSENRQPELSLELKQAVDSPGTIWSLRFSKSKRGCLGVMSSTGQVRVYDIGKDVMSEAYRIEHEHGQEMEESTLPQDVYLDHAQDIEKGYTHPAANRDENARIVSFDFTTSKDIYGQPQIITLDMNGVVRPAVGTPLPEPATFSSIGYFSKGQVCIQPAVAKENEVGELLDTVRKRAEPKNILKQSYKQSKIKKSKNDMKRLSSFANQTWYSDLGFYEKDMPIQDLLLLMSTQRMRCEAGYLFNPSRNKAIVWDSHWLQSFWAWVERSIQISKRGNMTQDHLDLSHLGVFGLWMEEVNTKNRVLGPTSDKISKIIEGLVKRLNIPSGKLCPTEYPSNRSICLHVTGLAWSYKDLEESVKRLVTKNQHTKAAAIALFASERKLAYKALRSKNATQSHKMLAMAIAGAAKRAKNDEGPMTDEDSDVENDWSETIASLAEELTDPYARAILAFVRSGDWSNVITEDSLPLKYRLGIALRHLDDSKLTRYISQVTKESIAAGDIEGVALVGISTNESFELLESYVKRFGDLQTAVLALCPTIPRYLDDTHIIRKFEAWKEEYRALMNSWGLKFDRVRFDVLSQRLAIANDGTGRRLLEVAKPQAKLVCSFCSQSVAQFETPNNDRHRQGENSTASSVQAYSLSQSPSAHVLETGLTKTQAQTSSPSQNTVQQALLPPEKVAALGNVCPKCGRHLPRCGVCDLWLGMPDETYLRWYGAQQDRKSLDLSASMSGSMQTAIGPNQNITTAAAGPNADVPKSSQRPKVSEGLGVGQDNRNGGEETADEIANGEVDIELEAKRVKHWDDMMQRFTVFCVKCSHGFHASHARMWFGRNDGREGHRVCPVATCQCVCVE